MELHYKDLTCEQQDQVKAHILTLADPTTHAFSPFGEDSFRWFKESMDSVIRGEKTFADVADQFLKTTPDFFENIERSRQAGALTPLERYERSKREHPDVTVPTVEDKRCKSNLIS